MLRSMTLNTNSFSVMRRKGFLRLLSLREHILLDAILFHRFYYLRLLLSHIWPWRILVCLRSMVKCYWKTRLIAIGFRWNLFSLNFDKHTISLYFFLLFLIAINCTCLLRALSQYSQLFELSFWRPNVFSNNSSILLIVCYFFSSQLFTAFFQRCFLILMFSLLSVIRNVFSINSSSLSLCSRSYSCFNGLFCTYQIKLKAHKFTYFHTILLANFFYSPIDFTGLSYLYGYFSRHVIF